jgi:hypothetical protein
MERIERQRTYGVDCDLEASVGTETADARLFGGSNGCVQARLPHCFSQLELTGCHLPMVAHRSMIGHFFARPARAASAAPARLRPTGYLTGEKSVGVTNTDSILS